MPQVNVSGVVLRCYDLGEKDRIVVLLTDELGKIRVVAKGAKRPGGRFAAAATPMIELAASISLGRNLHTVNQVQIVTSHRPLRERLESMAMGLFITDLIDHATVEGEEQSEWLRLLTAGLRELETTTVPQLALCFFLVQLLRTAGLTPVTEHCAVCQASQRNLAAISAAAGGLVCGHCAHAAGVFPLSPAVVTLLQHFLECDWADYAEVDDAQAGNALALCKALEQFAFYQLDVRPKSYDFLTELRVRR